jgi:hypothetical protein
LIKSRPGTIKEFRLRNSCILLCMTVSFTYSLLLFFICFLDFLLLLLLLFISFIFSYPIYFHVRFILLSPFSFHVKPSHWSGHTQSCTSQDTHNPAEDYDTHNCVNSQDTHNPANTTRTTVLAVRIRTILLTRHAQLY